MQSQQQFNKFTHKSINLEQLDLIFKSQNRKQFYQWSQSKQKWIQFHKEFNDSNQFFKQLNHFKINTVNKSLRSITLNILFDDVKDLHFFKRIHMKFSQQRFKAILTQIENINAQVITLNQVTSTFIEMLSKNQFIRKNYKLSLNPNNNQFVAGYFGNILITQLNPLALHVFKAQKLARPIIIAFFPFLCQAKQKENIKQKIKIISFSANHLTAYDKNYQVRAFQLKQIKKYLNQFNNCVSQHILQGDMNFHSQNQNKTVKQNQLEDCWMLVNQIKDTQYLKQQPGYTFDSLKNGFIQQIYWGYEKRRMRLDRIFTSKHTKMILEPQKMQIIFNKRIYGEPANQYSMGIIKSTLSILADIGGFNFLRKKQNYLFCSDHFGLLIQFILKL